MWVGLVTGFLIFAINMLVIALVLRKAQWVPEEEAPKYIAVRYYIRFVVLLVVLGIGFFFWGFRFALGTMAGILAGKLVLLALGGYHKELFVRLLRGDEEEAGQDE